MKNIAIVLATIIIAFLVSALLDWSWVANNPVRYALVVVIIILVLLLGWLSLKENAKQKTNQ
jgi:cell division protein FtsW (lipid II flippase)